LLAVINIKGIPQRRIERERRTIEVMVRLYCGDHHGAKHTLCDDCAELMAYAEKRLERCPFQEEKPTCTNCPIHCYKPDRRQKVKAVMRYSGPRMMLRHPIFALRHWIDGFKKAPPRGHPAAQRESES
jgi:hypothetical protein